MWGAVWRQAVSRSTEAAETTPRPQATDHPADTRRFAEFSRWCGSAWRPDPRETRRETLNFSDRPFRVGTKKFRMGRKHPTLTAGLAPPSVYGPCRKPQTDDFFIGNWRAASVSSKTRRFSAGAPFSSVARITRVFSKEALERTRANSGAGGKLRPIAHFDAGRGHGREASRWYGRTAIRGLVNILSAARVAERTDASLGP